MIKFLTHLSKPNRICGCWDRQTFGFERCAPVKLGQYTVKEILFYDEKSVKRGQWGDRCYYERPHLTRYFSKQGHTQFSSESPWWQSGDIVSYSWLLSFISTLRIFWKIWGKFPTQTFWIKLNKVELYNLIVYVNYFIFWRTHLSLWPICIA